MGAKKHTYGNPFYREESNDILLISIRPKFSELIRSGVKTVELRKRRPKKISEIAVIYESFPKKRASFVIRIKKVDSAPVQTIWKRYGKQCAVTREYFNSYYRGSKEGVAFLIEEVIPLQKAIGRKILVRHGLVPPQDYRYASKEVLSSISRSLV